MNAVWQVEPQWKFLLAKLFGKRHSGTYGGYKITVYQWRGKFWVTECRE